MMFRIVVINQNVTYDVAWLLHTGADVYVGYVGANNKYSYHGDGKRHQKFNDGRYIPYERHHPLTNFRGQFEICVFGFSPRSKWRKTFKGNKADNALYLNAKSLPELVNVRVGLLEPGNFAALKDIQHAQHLDSWNVCLITSTNPWVYATVQSIKPETLERFLTMARADGRKYGLEENGVASLLSLHRARSSA